MNELFIQSAIEDRERDIVKHAEGRQFYRHLRESIAERQDVTEKGLNVLRLLWSNLAKQFRGVFAGIPEDSLEVK